MQESSLAEWPAGIPEGGVAVTASSSDATLSRRWRIFEIGPALKTSIDGVRPRVNSRSMIQTSLPANELSRQVAVRSGIVRSNSNRPGHALSSRWLALNSLSIMVLHVCRGDACSTPLVTLPSS